MKMLRIIFALVAWFLVSGAAMVTADMKSPSTGKADLFVGVARMDKAGTICLQMLSESTDQPRAEGKFCYKKSEKKYEYIR